MNRNMLIFPASLALALSTSVMFSVYWLELESTANLICSICSGVFYGVLAVKLYERAEKQALRDGLG